MKRIILFIFILTFCFEQYVTAQHKNEEAGIALIASINPASRWYTFDKGVTPSAENINNQDMKSYFGFDTDNSFSLIKSETDELKIKHQTFQQMYKGYPVQFAQFKLHTFPDKPLEGNGYFISDFVKTVSPILSFLQALDFAKQYFPAQKYMWEDSIEEASLKERKHERNATYFPKEEMVWAITNKNIEDLHSENYSLAYKIIISASLPSFSKEIYIDAVSGKLLNVFELEYNCGTRTFVTNFNGAKTVQYSSNGTNDILKDNCAVADAISTSDNGTILSPYTKAPSASWPNTNNFNSACSSLWALREASNYYYYVHARPGWFAGITPFTIDLRQNSSFLDANGVVYWANASFQGDAGICRVGNHQSTGPNSTNTIVSDDWNSLDILAHELTHGVTYSSVGLVYQGESGALNESFSDIFGLNVYQYFNGFTNSNLWLIGYDRKDAAGNSLYIRNMADTHDRGQPDTYLTDASWLNPATTSGDNGGVHTNSGVQNHMYYLLAQGGSGTNANGFGYNITGLGFSQARAIAYRALTAGYLNANSNHAQARSAWVHAAIDLYGNCSVQSQTVGKAWEAVGVAAFYYSNSPICGNYAGTQSFQSNSPYLISSTGCATTILGTGNQVNFDGAGYVNISPGFNTNTGAFFTVKSSDCYYSNY